jgi:anti-sigma regulatory factor (Ser/Thr protein kinase)
VRELSLNILDIAENSLKAKATLVEIDVTVAGNLLTIVIKDNGCGMSKEFLAKVTDPYTTTRTTRSVGLGIPLIKMEAEMSGGSFEIQSTVDVGTTVTTTFAVDHIDRPPLGDVGETIMTLLTELNDTRIVFTYYANGQSFCFDTLELQQQLEGIPLDTPEILQFVKQLINENMNTINGGLLL